MIINFRKAEHADVESIVQLLAADKLGKLREAYEKPIPNYYYKAFSEITADPNQYLMIVEHDTEIIGTFQLSFIQYLTYKGGRRAQLEAVRVKDSYRGKGIGAQILNWAINQAKENGAHLLQLTTDKQRPEALKFYENLGFKASHEGLKLHF